MSDPHATLNYALGLLERGLSIIPVNTSGTRVKKPHFHALHGTGHSYSEQRGNRTVNVPSWKEFQHTRATTPEVMEWVLRYRVTGFAMVTGELSGIVGLDFDLDGLATLRALGWAPHVLTPSGGAHVYVRWPGFRVKTVKASGMKDAAMRLPAGVDVRGDGGYILLPPTQVEGGGRYVRTDERKFLNAAAIPETFMDGQRPCRLREVLGLTPPRPFGEQAAQRPLLALPGAMPSTGNLDRPPVQPILEGAADKANQGRGRNEAGFWFACQMRDNGYSQEECQRCYPGLVTLFPPCDTKGEISNYTEGEFLDSVRSAYRARPRQGWRPPTRNGRVLY